jgi:DNA-binding MarR family transcriptional regulator
MTSPPFDPIVAAADNWRAHGWGEPDVMAAVTSVMRAQQILIGRINALLRPHGLTFARYEVLVLLTFSRRGALPLRVVGERLQVHPASVTNAIDRLEQAGLVQRVPHPTDGRATLAEITGAGRRVVDEATRSLVGARFGADGLDDDAARALTEVLTDLRRGAGDLPD